jgi:proteasome lid subunit RPN8/RPN11
VRYGVDPLEQFNAFRQIANHGWNLLAIYHSHLAGSPEPSPTDIAQATYPEAVYLVWSRSEQGWVCRAYQIYQDRGREIEIKLVEDTQRGI